MLTCTILHSDTLKPLLSYFNIFCNDTRINCLLLVSFYSHFATATFQINSWSTKNGNKAINTPSILKSVQDKFETSVAKSTYFSLSELPPISPSLKSSQSLTTSLSSDSSPRSTGSLYELVPKRRKCNAEALSNILHKPYPSGKD